MRRGITIAEPEILNEIRERATWPVRKKIHFNDFDIKTSVTAHAFAPPAFSSRLTLPGVELILTDQTGFAFRRTHDSALDNFGIKTIPQCCRIPDFKCRRTMMHIL